MNASPNVAVLNGGGDCGCHDGGVKQTSNSNAGATATNANTSAQSIGQTQDGVQSRDGGSFCSRKGGSSIDQEQTATNSVDQYAKATAVSQNASPPNVAAKNKGRSISRVALTRLRRRATRTPRRKPSTRARLPIRPRTAGAAASRRATAERATTRSR